MSVEENKARMPWTYEGFATGELDALDDLVASDYVEHDAVPGQLPGIEALKQVASQSLAAFPDVRFVVEDIIAEGNKVVARYTMHGTHQAELVGIPPTGKQITVSGIDIVRFVDGKVKERWGNLDELGMMQQLGLIPAPGQAAG